jgi:rhodanese-related sulfurtransferase
MRSIDPKQASARLASEANVRLVDVRTPGEFAAVHAEAASNVPLDEVERRRGELGGGEVLLICKSGKRASQACEKLEAAGGGNYVVVAGGTDGWIAAGLPVVRGKGVISLERQVRIGAGSLVLIGAALAWFVNPGWLALPAFVGAGLVFAGVTDTCGMAMMLSRMPWNRAGGPRKSCSM